MQYDIPVAALDQALVVASHSAKRDKWYARTITIASSSLKKTADLPADETNKVADGIYECRRLTTSAAMFKVVGVKLTAKRRKNDSTYHLKRKQAMIICIWEPAADAAADERRMDRIHRKSVTTP